MSSTSNSSSSGSRWARTKTKTFLECPGQNIFRRVEKSRKSQTVWSQQSSKNKNKKCPILTFFPVLEKLTHMFSNAAINAVKHWFESSGWQIEHFELFIVSFKSSGWCFWSFPCLSSWIAGLHNLWSPVVKTLIMSSRHFSDHPNTF